MIMQNNRPYAVQRRGVEMILSRAELLAEADRVLLRQVLERGVSKRELAAVMGVAVRTVQKRVARLVRRLGDPVVAVVMSERTRWDAVTAGVAVRLWVRGLTMKRTAAELNLTLHEVRQRAQSIRAVIAAAGPTSHPIDPRPASGRYRRARFNGLRIVDRRPRAQDAAAAPPGRGGQEERWTLDSDHHSLD